MSDQTSIKAIKASRGKFWLDKFMTEQTALYIAATITGIVTGMGAALLKWLIGLISIFFVRHFDSEGPNYVLLVLPFIGILLSMLFTTYVIKRQMDHGSHRLMLDMTGHHYYLSPRLIPGPIVACAITLGFGCSAGAEDPIAYSGAAIGSNIARIWKMRKENVMILLGCGAGAGIAGIFMAPIGGMMFTLEVLKMELTTPAVLALMLACITAALVCYSLMGFAPDLSFPDALTFDPALLLPICCLGIVCGLYGAYYSRLSRYVIVWFEEMRNKWLKWIVSGAIVSALVFLLPPLYGEGYQSIGMLLANTPSTLFSDGLFFNFDGSEIAIILILAAILLVKALVSAATNTGGGIGGDFTPTLFAGCMMGYLFAVVVNQIFGVDLPVGNFAFFGMAAVMASAVCAPLMAIFITLEMTTHYELVMPIVIVAAISFGIHKLCRETHRYLVRH